MRYSKEHKQETHARIVKKASVRLREKGAHGIGVADLMKEAGLTHGGFYAHFDSREALVIEAFGYAMDRAAEHWRNMAAEIPPEKRLSTIVESYVSAAHRDDPGRGCAVPTLGAEIARESAKTRKAFAAKLDQMIDLVADQIPGRAEEDGAPARDGHDGDDDGRAGDVPRRRQRRAVGRNSRLRPRGGAGPRGEAGGEEGTRRR